MSLPCCFRVGGVPPGGCTALRHGVAIVYYQYVAEARGGTPSLAPGVFLLYFTATDPVATGAALGEGLPSVLGVVPPPLGERTRVIGVS